MYLIFAWLAHRTCSFCITTNRLLRFLSWEEQGPLSCWASGWLIPLRVLPRLVDVPCLKIWASEFEIHRNVSWNCIMLENQVLEQNIIFWLTRDFRGGHSSEFSCKCFCFSAPWHPRRQLPKTLQNIKSKKKKITGDAQFGQIRSFYNIPCIWVAWGLESPVDVAPPWCWETTGLKLGQANGAEMSWSMLVFSTLQSWRTEKTACNGPNHGRKRHTTGIPCLVTSPVWLTSETGLEEVLHHSLLEKLGDVRPLGVKHRLILYHESW